MSWKPEVEELRRRTELARRMGGPERLGPKVRGARP